MSKKKRPAPRTVQSLSRPGSTPKSDLREQQARRVMHELSVVPSPLSKLSRGQRRRHLNERLTALRKRMIVIEQELQRLDENRFYRTCIFGSARIKPGSAEYDQAYEVARLLARRGIDVLTGGGPGLMEAGNKGARAGIEEGNTRSLSYGINIKLDFEPVPNPHLDVRRHHDRFSSRLDEFMRLSHSIVVTPGGIGTLLELYFTWQLIQVKHLSLRPIVLLDVDFWQGIVDWMKDQPLARGLVSPGDFDFLHLVDTPEEVYKIISAHHDEFLAAAKKQVKLK